MSLSLEGNNVPESDRRYMFNWYVKKLQGPKLGVTIETFAGRQFGNREVTINHFFGTRLTF